MEIYLVTALKMLVEILGYTLIGQGVLALFAGSRRHQNWVYQLLSRITGPVIKAVRYITPKFVPDQHLGLVAFFLLFWLWVGLLIFRCNLCYAAPDAPCELCRGCLTPSCGAATPVKP